MVQLSIIILNYNVKHFLKLCLQSVVQATENIQAEIIVADNASKDGSMQMVAQDFPNVIRLENKKNLGFSKANNLAVKKAIGKYICILNPDTVVPEQIFSNLLKFVKTVPDFGAVGVKLVDGKGQFLPESKRQIPTPKVAFQKMVGNATNYYASNLESNDIGCVDVLVGAFMFMSRQRYLQVGGFDEDYFMYGEDIDLSYKLLKAGYKNYYYGKDSVIHFKGESTTKDEVYRARFYGAMQLFYKKHFSNSKFTNLIVKAALKVVKKANKAQGLDTDKEISSNVFIYIGNSSDCVSILSKLKNKQVQHLSLKELQKLTLKNSQLFLDSQFFSFKEIISLLEQYGHHNNTFRIKLKSSNVLIGSDTSTGKGEVLVLELDEIQ
ncbi:MULTISPECIES: glycosyltransferase family 2 protein [Croceibacter]|uniref:glycosyltransferase family 2 protein n=1 Tax=Croceibacter TaxID=216431 RepID=UPI000C62FCCA|nr:MULTISPECIES: glycosyltransferase family 2 protein [Croceibacter]MBG26543.1 glycosyltransferase [Croceibacter sp.]|tara:strand:+ start:6955 stop:8094 length:1140 start_codon:yes stop_codon:yes gene_type:complete